MTTPIKTRAPGKLILSGEHAVVHGAPALAMAVNRSMESLWTPNPGHIVRIHLTNSPPIEKTIEDLHSFREEAEIRYQDFLNGRLPAADVLVSPASLLFLTIAAAAPPHGGDLVINGDIPLGAGMGSSAALILSVLHALQPEWTKESLFRTALHCEHFQHGRSSGIDLFASQHGGVIQLEAGLFSKTDAFAPNLRVFFSGKPSCSTGECVAGVGRRFGAGHSIWSDFASVTRDFRSALQLGDDLHLQDCIKANHRLLRMIGVVPDPVQACIREIELGGGAAKICGAGAVRGSAAGMILVSGDCAMQTIAERYQLEQLDIQYNKDGLVQVCA